MILFDIDTIRSIVFELGKTIDAPLRLLSLPDKPTGDGSPYVEIKDGKYQFVLSDRGSESLRRETSDLDELLYWIFSGVASSMAFSYELNNRKCNQDSRRLVFSMWLELLGKLNPEWERLERIRLEGILSDHPYDDHQDARIALYNDLKKTRYSSEDAYDKACLKYPLP